MKKMSMKKLNELIKKTKRSAKNPQRPSYSQEIKNNVIKLTDNMSNIQIKKELGISESFIARLRKQANDLSTNKKPKTSSEFNFLQVDDKFNDLMKDDKITPVIKLTTNGGVTIEIFS